MSNADHAATSGTFLSTLANMNKGEVLSELDEALRECTKAALNAAAKAKLTLELTVVPNGEGVGGTPMFNVVDKIKTTIPKPPRQRKAVFYVDDDGNLTRRNPHQEELDLSVKEGGASLDGAKVSIGDLVKKPANG